MTMRDAARSTYEVREGLGSVTVPRQSCPSFIEATDFAFDYISDHDPGSLEIVLVEGASRETVWTYSRDRATAEAETKTSLFGLYGYPVGSWSAAPQFSGRRR
jgi:hypothetical protein